MGLPPGTTYTFATRAKTESNLTNQNTVYSIFSNEIPVWTLAILGDVSGDRKMDLADVILSLQALSGLNTVMLRPGVDVNGDGKVGIAEVAYILQALSGLKDG